MDKQQREAQREAVKTLAIAVGVREAARQLGLNEDRVRQWSKRFHWLKTEPKPQPPTVTNNDVTFVTKPSDALANTLKTQGNETKLNLSQATHKASKVFARVKGSTVIRQSEHLRRIVSSAAQIHGWEGQQQSSNLDINVLAGGRAMIQVVQRDKAGSE